MNERPPHLQQWLRVLPWLPLIVPLALLALASLVIVFPFYAAYRLLLHLAVWAAWLPRGRDILFVYSDSPVWHEYLDIHVLPHIQRRTVVLNWSQRALWRPFRSLAVLAFRHFAGPKDFNPIAIVFHPFRHAKVFRFYNAFKQFKNGNRTPIERLRTEFFAYASPELQRSA